MTYITMISFIVINTELNENKIRDTILFEFLDLMGTTLKYK